MNFRRKLVYIAISCLLILAALFTASSIIDFNAQDASAQSRFEQIAAQTVAIKIKMSHQVIHAESPGNQAFKESFRSMLENNLRDLKMKVVPYPEKDPIDWKIYCLLRTHGSVVGMSITLTHHDTLVMNHLTIVDTVTREHTEEEAQAQRLAFSEPLNFVLKVLHQKTKNKDTAIIVPDNSTIVVN